MTSESFMRKETEMPSLVDPKVFKNAIAIKDGLSKQQAKDITALYKDWADQIGELSEYYSKKTAPSYGLESLYNDQLKKQVTEMSKQVANGVYSKTSANLYTVADAVVADNAQWMKQFGLSSETIDAAFASISQSTVNALLTGSVYGQQGAWSLSKSIWGDNEDTLKKIYQVVAQGSVMQMSTSDIAKKLEQFVSPSKQFKWNGPKGYAPIFGKKVDYNAQRLARTLLQHCYQESFVAVAQKNPLITQVKYVANGSRVCDICKARDGKVYAITKVPLDHPNGMCVLEPVVNASQVDKLAAWVRGDLSDKDQKWWDNKMAEYGYDLSAKSTKELIAQASKTASKKVDSAVEQIAKDTGVKAKKTQNESPKLPSYKELLQQLQDKQKQAKAALDDLLKKYSSTEDIASVRFNKFIKNIKKYKYDDDTYYIDVFYYTNGKHGHNGGLAFREFRNALFDIETANMQYGTDAECKKIVNLYKELFGESPTFAKQNEYVKSKYAINYQSGDDLSSLMAKLFFEGDFDRLKDAGVSDASLKKAKNVIKNFYGFDADDVIEFNKLSNTITKSKNDISKLKTTGIFDGIETDKAASIAKKAKAKAEALAKKIAAKQQEAAEKLKNFRKSTFGKDAYSSEAKAAARKFGDIFDADKELRKELDDVWEELTDYEKYSVWKYTENSNPMNKVLSGYSNGSWSRDDFVGVGKADWSTEDKWRRLSTKKFKSEFGKDATGSIDHAKTISELTKAIDKSSMKKSIFVSRGDDISGVAGLLEGSDISFDKALKLLYDEDVSSLNSLCKGKQFQTHSFMSTATTSNAGFSHKKVNFEIYVPEGSHAIYAEPASYYGNTVGMKEKLYKVGDKHEGVSNEAEIILQRGSSFRITSISKEGEKIKIKMELVDQPDYFVTGYEQTIDGGKTLAK